jgi:hypothetical protein
MKKEIKAILERNKRVEQDKAWEISLSRRTLIALMTYFILVIFLRIIKIPNPWLNALIPAIAFVLSTLSLPFFKKIWINYVYKK